MSFGRDWRDMSTGNRAVFINNIIKDSERTKQKYQPQNPNDSYQPDLTNIEDSGKEDGPLKDDDPLSK